MQRSSASIAALATALAKAQIKLANPEKSLTGTIEPQGGEVGARQFRYAPLSSGLEIVRKTLGQHEIATVQTTAIDQAAGLVNLTTVLAHSSGEWIASDWPVCPVAETATPHRMGAALTYARRYALFTLVGIAGEDDLDAPDLLSQTAPETKTGQPTGNKNNGGQGSDHQRSSGRSAKAVSSRAKLMLEPEASLALREQLTAELKSLNSAEEAANWAHRVLSAKNKLTVDDAKHVENAFQARLARIGPEPAGGPAIKETGPALPHPRRIKKRYRASVVDKTVLALPTPRRFRDREHVKSVAKQPCLICGRRPADAHHLRFSQSPTLGRKVSDEFTVPLCRGHHREVHRCGDEAAWWNTAGIDPSVDARALWLKTHPLPPTSNKKGIAIATEEDEVTYQFR